MTTRTKARIGVVTLAALALASALYPLLADVALACPFGDDPHFIGQSVCSRTMSGLWRSIGVGLISGGATSLIGLGLALAARRFGRIADTLITRAADMFFAIPDVLVLIGIAIAVRQLEATGHGHLSPFWVMVTSLTAVSWAAPTRMIRNRLRSLESADFVVAAIALGATRWQIVTRELLPFAQPYVLAIFLLRVPAAILSESTVSFLGFGLPPDQPSLGSFIGDNYKEILGDAWIVVPAWGSLVAIVMAFQWTGAWVQARSEVTR
jgi:oligopeptide transport system permease protein